MPDLFAKFTGPLLAMIALAASAAHVATAARSATGEAAGDDSTQSAATLLTRLPDPATAERLTTDGYFKQRPAWSPDGGRLAFARHERDRIWLFVRDAKGVEKRLTNREHPEYDAVWSPDGKRLALCLVGVSGTQGDVDLYLAAGDGSGPVRLAGSDAGLSHEEWPAWSPDGRRIAFSSTRAGNQEIFLADADTNGKNLTRLTNEVGLDAHPAWSPDGKQIAFSTDRWGGLESALMQADGSNVRRVTHSRGLDDYPAWSPDGRLIAFTSNRDGNLEIYLMLPDGSHATNLTRSTSVDNFATWTPDGRSVTFVSDRARGFDIYSLRLSGSRD